MTGTKQFVPPIQTTSKCSSNADFLNDLLALNSVPHTPRFIEKREGNRLTDRGLYGPTDGLQAPTPSRYLPLVRMAADRVRGGYPRVLDLRLSGLVCIFHLRICEFGYPKFYGFGANLYIYSRSSIGGPKLSPVKTHLATLAI